MSLFLQNGPWFNGPSRPVATARSSRFTCTYLHVWVRHFRVRRVGSRLEPGSGLVAWPPRLLRAASCGLCAVVWVIWGVPVMAAGWVAPGVYGGAAATRLARVLRRRRRV